jgi:hypothetical protein
MKTKVIKFFQNLPKAPHDQFNEAFALYRDSEGKNVAVERNFNARGYTPSSLSNLLYDLQKMHGITDVEKVRSEKLEVGSEEEEGSQELEVGSEELDSLKEENEGLKSENEDLLSEKEELEFENLDLKEEIETLKLAPKLDAKQIRVEFPFLNDKDCPNELKILVADKITAWNEYLDIQKTIGLIESGELEEKDTEKLASLAKKAIKAFDENKKIYDELNCYQTTGKVLGVHPIFKKLQLTREVETMTADELIKYKGSSAKYFSVKKTALEKAKKEKDEAKVLEIEAAIAERNDKLFLVNKKLGV